VLTLQGVRIAPSFDMYLVISKCVPIPVAARSKAARLLGLWVRIPPGGGGHVCLSLVNVVCCQVEVSASG